MKYYFDGVEFASLYLEAYLLASNNKNNFFERLRGVWCTLVAPSHIQPHICACFCICLVFVFLCFVLYLYFAGWQRGRGLVHLSGSVSHPAIYPLHGQERIEYIKISFTEITKIRKKPPAPIPNKGFFAPSGVESITPGASIV